MFISFLYDYDFCIILNMHNITSTVLLNILLATEKGKTLNGNCNIMDANNMHYIN